MGNISHDDFQKVRQSMMAEGFSENQRNKVEEIFRGDLDESGSNRGISPPELQEGFKWMRSHTSEHGFSEHQMSKIEAIMQRHAK